MMWFLVRIKYKSNRVRVLNDNKLICDSNSDIGLKQIIYWIEWNSSRFVVLLIYLFFTYLEVILGFNLK